MEDEESVEARLQRDEEEIPSDLAADKTGAQAAKAAIAYFLKVWLPRA